jgi:hypothetical protein
VTVAYAVDQASGALLESYTGSFAAHPLPADSVSHGWVSAGLHPDFLTRHNSIYASAWFEGLYSYLTDRGVCANTLFGLEPAQVEPPPAPVRPKVRKKYVGETGPFRLPDWKYGRVIRPTERVRLDDGRIAEIVEHAEGSSGVLHYLARFTADGPTFRVLPDELEPLEDAPKPWERYEWCSKPAPMVQRAEELGLWRSTDLGKSVFVAAAPERPEEGYQGQMLDTIREVAPTLKRIGEAVYRPQPWEI